MRGHQKLQATYNVHYTIMNFKPDFREKYLVNEKIRSNPIKLSFGTDEMEWLLEFCPNPRNPQIGMGIFLRLIKSKESFNAGAEISLLDEHKRPAFTFVKSSRNSARIRMSANSMGKHISYEDLQKFTINANLSVIYQLKLSKQVPLEPLECIDNGYQSSFGKMFEEELFTDFTIKANNGVVFKVHKAVLAVRSPVFMTILTNDLSESSANEVNVPDFDSKVIKELLRFIYTNTIHNVDEFVNELVLAAKKYQLKKLQEKCCQVLATKISSRNVIDLMILADTLGSQNKLYTSCMSCIIDNYDSLSKTKKWKKIDRDLLACIFDRYVNKPSNDFYL